MLDIISFKLTPDEYVGTQAQGFKAVVKDCSIHPTAGAKVLYGIIV